MFKIVKEKLNEDARIFNAIEELNICNENVNQYQDLEETLKEGLENSELIDTEIESIMESLELDEEDFDIELDEAKPFNSKGRSFAKKPMQKPVKEGKDCEEADAKDCTKGKKAVILNDEDDMDEDDFLDGIGEIDQDDDGDGDDAFDDDDLGDFDESTDLSELELDEDVDLDLDFELDEDVDLDLDFEGIESLTEESDEMLDPNVEEDEEEDGIDDDDDMEDFDVIGDSEIEELADEEEEEELDGEDDEDLLDESFDIFDLDI